MRKSDAQRRKEADTRKREKGLTRVAVWVPADKKAELVEFAKNLEESQKRQ